MNHQYYKVVNGYWYAKSECEDNKAQAKVLLETRTDDGFDQSLININIEPDERPWIYLCHFTYGKLYDVLCSTFGGNSIETCYHLDLYVFNDYATRYALRIKYLEHIAKYGTLPVKSTVVRWSKKLQQNKG